MKKRVIGIGFARWLKKLSIRIGPGKWYILLSLVLMASVVGSPAYGQEEKVWTGNINFLIGQKWLDETDWEPLDEQFELGLQYDFRPVEWPVNLAIDVLYSWDDATLYDPWLGSIEVEARTLEINPGVRKIWELPSNIHPFIGGGPAFIWVDGEGSSQGVTLSDDDWGFGVWLCGGAYVTLMEMLNLGLQVRYSWAEIELLGVEGEAGGLHLGVLMGFHW